MIEINTQIKNKNTKYNKETQFHKTLQQKETEARNEMTQYKDRLEGETPEITALNEVEYINFYILKFLKENHPEKIPQHYKKDETFYYALGKIGTLSLIYMYRGGKYAIRNPEVGYKEIFDLPPKPYVDPKVINNLVKSLTK